MIGTELDRDAASRLWHPVAASSDLPFRHVYHAVLLGRELALWRADDGHVNAWENRCLHRGVRLSIGINDGAELACQYHGWRYANRTAGCTYIPAHPADAPARTICNNTYPVRESDGLVWVSEAPDATLASPLHPNNEATNDTEACGSVLPLRAIPVNAPMALVRDALLGAAQSMGSLDSEFTQANPYTLCTRTHVGPRSGEARLTLRLQPLDAHRTVIRGLLSGAEIRALVGETPTSEDNEFTSVPVSTPVLSILQEFNFRLTRLREHIETDAITLKMPDPFTATIQPVSELLASMPEQRINGRKAPLRLKVARIVETARHVRAFELESIQGQLPTGQPGSHIDVHLPNGLVRQYSLTNGPGDTDCYRIAVKRTVDSQGGSSALHETVREGDVLNCSVPRNNFVLRRDATYTLLIAGGIGITALISMAKTLHHARLPFNLHYFVNSTEEMAFAKTLSALGAHAKVHLGLDPKSTLKSIDTLLAEREAEQHVYFCGPQPMLDAGRASAARQLWPDKAVHFEYFGNSLTLDKASGFRVELARSGLSFDVLAGQSLLEALREHDVELASSCEQGACGTCRVAVIEGEIDHQDVYLTDSERAAGKSMMSCVSRAHSDRLILDL